MVDVVRPLYADIVRPYLTGHLEEHLEGIFHACAEAPADRHTISELLKDPSTPWIPAEYSPLYEKGVVRPLSIAESMPQRLRKTASNATAGQRNSHRRPSSGAPQRRRLSPTT